MILSERDEARFWSKAALPNEQGCMLWLAGLDTHGYGQIRLSGARYLIHRLSYTLAYGSIPDGLQVDHLCRVRHCVAPNHLEAVTGRENTIRGQSPCGLNAHKTRCPKGHPYDEANTCVSGGRRFCRACSRERRRRAAA